MARHSNSQLRRGGSITNALVAVVALGVGATVAIPRIIAARAEALDVAAVAALHDVVATVERYRSARGALPASPDDAGVVHEESMVITMWARQVVGGVESVHIHLKHERSSTTFHAHYPKEDVVTALPEDWGAHQ